MTLNAGTKLGPYETPAHVLRYPQRLLSRLTDLTRVSRPET